MLNSAKATKMKTCITILTLVYTFNLGAAVIFSIENPDGSYTTGLNSDSRGEPSNSVLALLQKAAGYTIDNNNDGEIDAQASNIEINSEFDAVQSKDLLTPHLEILELIEVFLKLKGELASKVYAVVSDNSELIRSVSNTLINKISNLHTFTLTGIKILRKILEFAVTLLGQWHVTLPSFSLDVNKGFFGGQIPNNMYGLPKDFYNNND